MFSDDDKSAKEVFLRYWNVLYVTMLLEYYPVNSLLVWLRRNKLYVYSNRVL